MANSSVAVPNSGHSLNDYRSNTAPFSISEHGAIDGIFDRHLVGWTYDEHKIENNPVILYLDGHEVARAAATEYRPDIELAGYGDGKCGFELLLPHDLTGKEVVHVRLGNSFLIVGNSGRPLREYDEL